MTLPWKYLWFVDHFRLSVATKKSHLILLNISGKSQEITMPVRFRLVKRIRNAWRRLFPRKIYEFEGLDEDNQMSEDDLEEMLSGVSHYVEKMRAEHLKNIDLIRRGHDSADGMDSNQNYYKKTDAENIPHMNENKDNKGEVIEGDITCIRCEKYGCEVLIQIRPIGQ